MTNPENRMSIDIISSGDSDNKVCVSDLPTGVPFRTEDDIEEGKGYFRIVTNEVYPAAGNPIADDEIACICFEDSISIATMKIRERVELANDISKVILTFTS